MLFNAIHFVRPDTPDQEDVAFLANRYRQRKTDQPKFRILVAEDNAVNQKVIGLILEKAGHSVRIVENGELALDALKETGQFDLALLDLNMPVMSGIEVAKIYQYITQTDSRIPIVALTADATVETRKLCDEARFDAYVTKPFESRLLLETISRLAHKSVDKGDAAPGDSRAQNADGSGPSEEPLDLSVMKELLRLGASEDFIRNVTRLFLEGTEEKLRNMRLAVKTQNSEAFRQLNHALKGSAGQIGAMRLSAICHEYSKVGHEEFLLEGKRMLEFVKEEYARVCGALSGHGEEFRKIIP
jgi:two-component system sensor histidine kinase RpfC